MIKLSYILPCYNVAEYISRCIDSILAQDLQVGEYEIICVNDCSTDNIIDIISDYQKLYPNIKLINHSKNLTAGGARNTGIDNANGKYIWFVDPDDAVCSESVSNLLQLCENEDLDILVFNEKYYEIDGSVVVCNRVINSPVFSGQNFLTTYFSTELANICSVCNQIFKTTYLKESNIRYPKIPASQDVVYLWEVFVNAQRVKSISEICYSVYKRKDSTTGVKGRYTAKTCFSFVVLFPLELIKLIQRIEIDEILLLGIKKAIRRTINDNSRILYYMSSVEREKFYVNLVNYRSDIIMLETYMNKTTKRLLRNYFSFYIWNLVILIHKLWKS